ncbi:MAG: AraC family transcriptional regulator [Spirochaetia bacterium]
MRTEDPIDIEIIRLSRSELGLGAEPPRLHFSLPVNLEGPMDQDWPVHPYTEIFYVDSGSGTVKIEGRPFKAEPGSILLFRPEEQHRTILTEKQFLKGGAVHFSTNSLTGEFGRITPENLYSLKDSNRSELKGILSDIALENRELQVGARNMADALLTVFLIRCIRLSGINPPKRDATPGAAAMRRIVEGCTDYIKKHFHETVTLEETAAQCGVSSFYLSHVFSNYTGTTFSENLLSVRMKAAVELLEDPEIPLKEIARRTGYGDIYYFTKVFKKHFLLPPGAYRRTKLSGTRKNKEKTSLSKDSDGPDTV